MDSSFADNEEAILSDDLPNRLLQHHSMVMNHFLDDLELVKYVLYVQPREETSFFWSINPRYIHIQFYIIFPDLVDVP